MSGSMASLPVTATIAVIARSDRFADLGDDDPRKPCTSGTVPEAKGIPCAQPLGSIGRLCDLARLRGT